MVGTRFWPSTGWHYRFSRTVLVSFSRGSRICSRFIGEPGSSLPSTVSTILQQLWIDCMPPAQVVGGLQQIETVYKSCVVWLHCYLLASFDPCAQTVHMSDSGRARHSIKRVARSFTGQLSRNLAQDNTSQRLHGSGAVASDGLFGQSVSDDYETFLHVRKFSSCAVLERQSCAEQLPVDEAFGWLKAANLSGATEGLVVAAQNQALRTQYYEDRVMHRDANPTCLVCSGGLENSRPRCGRL